MNDEQNDELPPKMIKAQLVRLDDNLKQIERRQVAGIQRAPGSLPVLEAFQTFLENEQRKARRRMLAVALFAVVLLCAAAAGGFLLVRHQLRQAAADFEAVGNRTASIAATVDSLKRDQDAELLALENRFRDESSQIIAQYSSLQQEQQALAEAGTVTSSSLETLEERLIRLETENAALQERVTALAAPTTWPERASRAPAERPSPPATGPAAAETPVEPAIIAGAPATGRVVTATPPIPANPAVTVIEHPLVYLMTIVPEGHTSGIRWMLPRQITPE